MIHIRNLTDCNQLTHDHELWREVHGQLSVCIAEFLEYENEDDLADYDFNFMIATEQDTPYVNALGPPEEYAVIEIHSETVKTIYRLIYVTEVLFIPGELVDKLSIL